MRAAGVWRAGCAVLALLVWAQASRAASKVYGLEHGIEGRTERVLVFADGPVTPQVRELDGSNTELLLPGTSLDASAPRRASLEMGGHVSEASAFEKGTPAEPAVQILVRHTPGLTPKLIQRGDQIALEWPRRAESRVGELSLNVKDAELDEIVKRISRHTGVPVIYDETLAGRVTVMALKPFTASEALLLMDTILLLKGYAAVPTPGGPRKIVRIEGADSPFVRDVGQAQGDQPVTTMLHLREVNVDTVLAALRPMLGNSTLGFAHAPTNALILAGSADRITRIADVVSALDAAGGEHMFLRPLHFADAERTAEQLEDAFDGKGLVAVYPDTRTNTLAVRAKVELIPKLREFIARVDRPPTTTGQLHVFPVQHADPEQMAEILRALQGGTAGSRGAAARALGPRAQAVAERIGGANVLEGRDFAVVVDPPTHSLVVQSDPATARVIHDLVGELDRPPRQVEVEVSVMEIGLNKRFSLGFDALLPLTDPNDPDDLIAFVSAIPTGSANALFDGTAVEDTIAPIGGLPPVDSSLLARFARAPIFLPILLPDGSTRAVAIPRETAALTADQADIVQRMIMRPRITVVSGEEHEIFVGDNVPIRTAQADSVDPLQVRQNIERQDTGVTLRVKPTIGEEGSIQLELTVEVSSVVRNPGGRRLNLDPPGGDGDSDGYGDLDGYLDGDGYGDDGAPEFPTGDPTIVGPTIQKRMLTSTIRIENDRVAVIGYQSGPLQLDLTVGTPFFKDIPIIGWLFKSTTHRQLENHLLITVAARRDDAEVRALASALRRALAPRSAERVPEL